MQANACAFHGDADCLFLFQRTLDVFEPAQFTGEGEYLSVANPPQCVAKI